MKFGKQEKPIFYAQNLGKGKFAGISTYTYECPKCHRRRRASLGTPRCLKCNCCMIRVG